MLLNNLQAFKLVESEIKQELQEIKRSIIGATPTASMEYNLKMAKLHGGAQALESLLSRIERRIKYEADSDL